MTNPDAAPLLVLRDLTVGYGASPVVRNLHLDVHSGEIVALLGANGAGKTTTLRAISGLLAATSGTITFDGAAASPRHRRQLATRGLAHVPDNRGVFQSLTVRQNLLVDRRVGHQGVDTALDLFPTLAPLIDRQAGLLSGGEQQMLALGRALATRPRLLLLDEMSHGLAPIVVERILPTLTNAVTELGCAVLIVEQHVHLALDIADRAYVLARGELAFTGTASEIAANTNQLEAAYLGAE